MQIRGPAVQPGMSEEYIITSAELLADGMPTAFAMAAWEVVRENVDHGLLTAIQAALAARVARIRSALKS